jgi:hypothetical protein
MAIYAPKAPKKKQLIPASKPPMGGSIGTPVIKKPAIPKITTPVKRQPTRKLPVKKTAGKMYY